MIENEFQCNQEKWKKGNGKNKLDMLIMCENIQNETIQMIQDKFNWISKTYFGNQESAKLEMQVDSGNMGQLMIDFENLRL